MRAPCFTRTLPFAAALGLATLGCGGGAPREGPLVVFNAGSLARPMKAALDAFATQEGVRVEQESAGSLESARKLTDLGKIPDLIALADEEVFPVYLMPEHVDEYVRFARNRMVVAYTNRSRYANTIAASNWWEVLQRSDVEVGRSDPDLDPNGYRTLMVWQLAELAVAEPGLAAALEQRAPPRNVRPKEADLVGLLQAGEFDFIWSYESMARATGLQWVALGDSVDLSSLMLSEHYAQASVTVRGARGATGVTFRGQPIVYGFAVPRNAPHPALATRFAEFLLSDEGRAILRAEGLDVIDEPTTIRGSASAAEAFDTPRTPGGTSVSSNPAATP